MIWPFARIYLRDILSTPTAIPREISFDSIAWDIVLIAMRPEEQSLFTVEIGTVCGIPAARAAALLAYAGDGGWHVPV